MRGRLSQPSTPIKCHEQTALPKRAAPSRRKLTLAASIDPAYRRERTSRGRNVRAHANEFLHNLTCLNVIRHNPEKQLALSFIPDGNNLPAE
jgi:hypothetical protein